MKRMFGPHAAAMLRCRVLVRAHAAGLHLLAIELQDLSGMVVGPDHGMTKAHLRGIRYRCGNSVRWNRPRVCWAAHAGSSGLGSSPYRRPAASQRTLR